MLPVVLLLSRSRPLSPDQTELPRTTLRRAGASAGSASPSAEELMHKLDAMKDLADKDKTFEVAASVAACLRARPLRRSRGCYLAQALDKAKPARTFYLEQKKAAGRSRARREHRRLHAQPDDHLDHAARSRQRESQD